MYKDSINLVYAPRTCFVTLQHFSQYTEITHAVFCRILSLTKIESVSAEQSRKVNPISESFVWSTTCTYVLRMILGVD